MSRSIEALCALLCVAAIGCAPKAVVVAPPPPAKPEPVAIMPAPAGTYIDGVIANVGSRILLHSDLATRVAQAEDQGAKLSPAETCSILEDLLFEHLLLEQARLDSVVVDEAQVNAELDRRIRYFSQQIGGDEELEKYYGKTLERIKADFRDQVADQLLAQQMRSTITGDKQATPKEVEAFYRQIPKDSLPFINASIEFARIVRYAEPSEAEDRRVKKYLEDLRTRIVEGKLAFDVAAILDSQDEGSVKEGGLLPMVKPGIMVPEFDAVAMSLKDGEISQVFKTDFGYHTMMMVNRKGEQYQARHILRKLNVASEDLRGARTYLDSVAGLVRDGRITWAMAARDMNQDEETKGTNGTVMEPNSNSPTWAIGDLDKEDFFVLDKMVVGDISTAQPFEEPGGRKGYRILKLNKRTQPHAMDLVVDYPLISQAAENAAQQKSIDKWVREHLNMIYVRVHPDFANCPFNFPWVKKSVQ